MTWIDAVHLMQRRDRRQYNARLIGQQQKDVRQCDKSIDGCSPYDFRTTSNILLIGCRATEYSVFFPQLH